MASKVIFDLDGTLVDTRQAVRLSYRAAGVEMPPDAWGKPWHQWLFDPKIHIRKNELYPAYVHGCARALPLLEVALRDLVPVITGASRDAVNIIKARFGAINIVLNNASLQQKIDYLNWYGTGVYVDDDEATRLEVIRRTRWAAVSPEAYLEEIKS